MIRIQALSHRYAAAATPALTDISLNIGRGECWGLLGANGAGKTTLMSILCGLQEVQSGQVLFEGVPMQALSRRQRQQIGLVPQDFAFYPQLSVWDNMLFFAALYRQRDRAHRTDVAALHDGQRGLRIATAAQSVGGVGQAVRV